METIISNSSTPTPIMQTIEPTFLNSSIELMPILDWLFSQKIEMLRSAGVSLKEISCISCSSSMSSGIKALEDHWSQQKYLQLHTLQNPE